VIKGPIEQHALFHRKFELTETPPRAELEVRALRDCSVALNTLPIKLPLWEYPNQERRVSIQGKLHRGANELVVEVINDMGPPALWLSLVGPGLSLGTDQDWLVSRDGATEVSAHAVEQPLPIRPGNPASLGISTFNGVVSAFRSLLLFAILSGTALYSIALARRRGLRLRPFGQEISIPTAGLLAVSLLWAVLFIHDTFTVPVFRSGFDAYWHLNYIKEIQDHHHLPFADEGWEMYQPPLYYLLGAGLLSLCRLSTSDLGAVVVLRAFGLATGLATLALIAASLRLLFPENPRRQLAGIIFAAFVPVDLYLSVHISNEMLLAALVTASIYMTLHILANPQPRAWHYSLLGLLLGAALLTKITALVAVVAVLLVLAARVYLQKPGSLWISMRNLGAALAVVLAVSGWHYTRVWARFGTPLVGNYDAASGYYFWMYPGLGSFGFLTRFGQSLVNPFFSGLNSILDGVYSTAFGDGLCGGSAWPFRPPWNYPLMAAGYWLAVLPSLAVVVGLVSAVIKLLRRPRSEWFLLLGVLGGLAAATLFQILRYPYYAHGKAFYELSGLLPVCALAAVGIDLMAGPYPGPRAFIMALLLSIWTCTAYASFWIQPQSADTLTWEGVELMRRVPPQPAKAEECFRKALEIDPHHVPARLNLSGFRFSAGQRDRARQLLQEVLHDDPDRIAALWSMSTWLQNEGKLDEAVDYLRRAVALAPDDNVAWSTLAGAYLLQNRLDEAIAAYRESLRINPMVSPQDHADLGLALARAGRVEESIACYRQALRVKSDEPPPRWQAHLAWILAVQARGKYGASSEPEDLVREACKETKNLDPGCLQALAAIEAVKGRYRNAADVARRASRLAAAQGRTDLLQQLQIELQAYEAEKPLKDSPPPQLAPYTPVSAPSVMKQGD
jgi:tetratricopeptide (TPR) repeat protein